MMVARVWAKHGLKPQRLDRYMASNEGSPQAREIAASVWVTAADFSIDRACGEGPLIAEPEIRIIPAGR